jgi:hypothetical protein
MDVKCFAVDDNGQVQQCQVGFSISAKSGRGGVVEISEVGRKAHDVSIGKKSLVC